MWKVGCSVTRNYTDKEANCGKIFVVWWCRAGSGLTFTFCSVVVQLLAVDLLSLFVVWWCSCWQ
jgi:hypothetical protein